MHNSIIIPALYRKRASTVQAIKYQEHEKELFCMVLASWGAEFQNATKKGIKINLLGRSTLVCEGDYIVRDGFGVLSVAKEKRFEALYEKE